MAKTILLADDSVTIQKVVELAFAQNGYEVDAVGSGAEALARLETARPDVLITDVHMPGGSGYDVCRQAKERYPGIPVVLLVGAFEAFEPADVEACGADASVKKPFDSKELFATVERLVSEAPSTAAEAAESPLFDTAAPQPVASGSILDPAPFAVDPAAPIALGAADPSPVSGGGSDPGLVFPSADSTPVAAEIAAPAAEPATPDVAVETTEAAESSNDTSASTESASLSDEDVDRIARRVVELLGSDGLRELAWEVIPDMAEIVIKDRLRELESQVE